MKHIPAYLATIIIVTACIKTDPVSPIPQITYNKLDVQFYQDTLLFNVMPVGNLEFNFIDGDADFGIYEEETDTFDWNENNYNVFLTPYYKTNGKYFAIEFDTNIFPPPWKTVMHNTRLDRVGQNRTIQGTINIEIFDVPLNYDTVRYEFYIRDRAGNNSNTETTDDIATAIPAEEENTF